LAWCLVRAHAQDTMTRTRAHAHACLGFPRSYVRLMNFPPHPILLKPALFLHSSQLVPLKPLLLLHSYPISISIENYCADFQSLKTFFSTYYLLFESFLASLAALRLQLQVYSERFHAALATLGMIDLHCQKLWTYICNVIGTTAFFTYPIDRWQLIRRLTRVFVKWSTCHTFFDILFLFIYLSEGLQCLGC
jgi:hypothetical protein